MAFEGLDEPITERVQQARGKGKVSEEDVSRSYARGAFGITRSGCKLQSGQGIHCQGEREGCWQRSDEELHARNASSSTSLTKS